MDAAQALADLAEISSQLEAAVLLDEDGAVEGSTLADEERARRIGEAAARLLEGASQASTGRGGEAPTQLEAATPDGSVFVVREGGRTIVATTAAEPTVGLVFYDLKSCLRSLDEPAKAKPKPKPKPRRPRKQAEEAQDGAA